MSPTDAMVRLDAIVASRPAGERDLTAGAIYAAANAGLLSIPIPPRVLYGWMLKWYRMEEQRGRRLTRG